MIAVGGQGIFLAQFASDAAPFNTLAGIAEWAAWLGFASVQIPGDERLFYLELAAERATYCGEARATLDRHGVGSLRAVDASARTTGCDAPRDD